MTPRREMGIVRQEDQLSRCARLSQAGRAVHERHVKIPTYLPELRPECWPREVLLERRHPLPGPCIHLDEVCQDRDLHRDVQDDQRDLLPAQDPRSFGQRPSHRLPARMLLRPPRRGRMPEGILLDRRVIAESDPMVRPLRVLEGACIPVARSPHETQKGRKRGRPLLPGVVSIPWLCIQPSPRAKRHPALIAQCVQQVVAFT